MKSFAIAFAIGAVALAMPCLPAAGQSTAERPNVVVIMTDDLGYSDLGCYGSEIATPNLDRLAAHGVRFSEFYNTAKCHSSRVSLLTGQYCIAAGDVALSHAVTSAEVLGEGGYYTAMTGKWHLKQQPTDFGFQRYFGHLSGACNYFKGDASFRLNGDKWQVPAEGFYTTVANVDYAIDFLGAARESAKPWYLYLAFNAPHAPLQALPEDYAKYEGRYDQGWDHIREARVAKQRQIGLFSEAATPSPRPEHIPAWDSLSNARRQWEAKRMTALAAMIDRVDQEIGRLVDDLQAHDELDNTLILFVSDNGACPYDRRSADVSAEPTSGDVAWSDSTGWAWARNSPFRYYKQNQFEGGICTPAIVHWPAGLQTPAGSIIREPAHLIDVMPTLAEIGGCKIPAQWPDRELHPVSGVSLVPLFRGEPLSRREPLHFLFSQDRGLRDGDWKIVSFRGETWELYNLADDRTELTNLADSQPQRVEAMVQQWTAMARDVLHAPAGAYAPTKPAQLPHQHPEWTNFDVEPGVDGRRSGKRRASTDIRARKNTDLRVVGGTLELQFHGDDPGIAIDLRNEQLAAGPYVLAFRLSTKLAGQGEVFYTTDPQRTLPNGERVGFTVEGSSDWQEVRVQIPTGKQLQQLRLDVSDGPGAATIDALQLISDEGKTLMAWPRR